MIPVLVTPPAALAVELDDVKAYLRVEHGDHDVMLTDLLKGQIDYLDGWHGILGRALITQTWRFDLPWFVDPIRLPLLPPIDKTSVAISYFPSDGGGAAALDMATVEIFDDGRGLVICRAAGQSWPSTADRVDAVEVTFDAGYGATGVEVPPPIRSAIKFAVGLDYEPPASADAEQIKRRIDSLLRPFRKPRV